jgi:predicted AlkP superfamily pyrophosphatase or phosphodiesterase
VARSLTIFIDALPFDQLPKMPYTREFASQARLIPILGYSVNCQTQLFTGQTPDEIGFWCEWQYDPDGSPFRKWRSLLSIASLAEGFYPARRIIHKIGHSVFNRRFFDKPSLLDTPGYNLFLYSDFSVPSRFDEDAFQATLEHINREEDPGHALVTFVQIDAISHRDGVDSAPYDAMLAQNDDYIRRLSEAYLQKVPDGTVFVVSDHGMSNIEHEVRLDLEGRFGQVGTESYAYFVEGTILRVWCADTGLRSRIDAYLQTVRGIERYSEEERKRDGLTRPDFGDLIYHSLEKYQFVPSFWGDKPSVGMHGHHPRYSNQHGVCLSNRKGDFEGEIRAGEFYRLLASHLSA